MRFGEAHIEASDIAAAGVIRVAAIRCTAIRREVTIEENTVVENRVIVDFRVLSKGARLRGACISIRKSTYGSARPAATANIREPGFDSGVHF